MSFDPCHCSLKIWKSIWDFNSKNGSSLRSVKVHFLTLFCTPKSMRWDFWASFLAHTLASPCLGREPKVRVAINNLIQTNETWFKPFMELKKWCWHVKKIIRNLENEVLLLENFQRIMVNIQHMFLLPTHTLKNWE
jgi:hypothetical protein